MGEVARWLGQHSALTYQMPGTLQAFDALAKQFLGVEGEARGEVLAAAQALLAAESDEGSKEAAAYYVKAMSKITTHTFSWVTSEALR
jgi:hypothetical protein